MKKIVQGLNVLEDILEGARKASSLIVSTMGPGGNLVCIPNKYKLRFTKDGATVAQNLDDLESPVESLGVKLITQASKDMSERVGDGSTTVVCLLYKMMEVSVNLIRSGYKPNEIIHAIKLLKHHVHTTIESINTKIDVKSKQMTQIATIAANGDELIGKLIAQMLEKLGSDGAIIAEESINNETYTDIKEGFYFNKGVSAGFFKLEEQERMKIELDSPLILVVGQKLNAIQPLLPIIQHVAQMGKSLLIVADDIDNDVINTFAFNRNIGKINALVVKADGFGDRKHTFLEDIAIFTGSTIISESNNNFHNMNVSVLGVAKKVQMTKDNTIIIGGNGSEEHKNQRINAIKHQIQQSTSSYDKEKLQERLSKLSSGIGTIYVGGQTELEIKELKDRVEDAIHACKNALKRGIVPGAGTELMYAGFTLNNHENIIVKKFAKIVLETIVRTIVNNMDICSSDVILEQLEVHFTNKKHEMGFNGATGKICNLMEAGIINPTSVSEIGIDIATANCITFIQTSSAILEYECKKNNTLTDNDDLYK